VPSRDNDLTVVSPSRKYTRVLEMLVSGIVYAADSDWTHIPPTGHGVAGK
jgi:hypothetical protein